MTIKISIEDSTVEEFSGISQKTGKPFTIRKQEAWVTLPGEKRERPFVIYQSFRCPLVGPHQAGSEICGAGSLMALVPACESPTVTGDSVTCGNWIFVSVDNMSTWDLSMIDPLVFGQSFAAGFSMVVVFWLIGLGVGKIMQLIRY